MRHLQFNLRIPVALLFAWRDIRAGLTGHYLHILCIMLGTASLSGIDSLAASSLSGIESQARSILGGDIDLRLPQRPATAEEIAGLKNIGALSHVIEMRAMAHKSDNALPLLVEMKGVDSAYPLYGNITTRPPINLQSALSQDKDGRYGALLPLLAMQRMGLSLGDEIVVGKAHFIVKAILAEEPDAATQFFALGPRLLVSEEGMAATGLLQPGSLFYHRYRILLPEGADPQSAIQTIDAALPQAGWQIRQLKDAGQNLRRTIDVMRDYLDLIGLSALLIGGLGIASAVRAYLESRAASIAILKCLGASKGQIFSIYLSILAIVSAIAIALGLGIGIFAAFFLQETLRQFGFHAIFGLYPKVLLNVILISFLGAQLFSLPSLWRAARTRPAQLLRHATIELGLSRRRDWAALAGVAIISALVIVGFSTHRWLAFYYCLGALAALIFFHFLTAGLQWIARIARLNWRHRSFIIRLSLASLSRRGAPLASVVLALGLGLTVLAAILVVEDSVRSDLMKDIPKRAPSFYFIDIRPEDITAFKSTLLSLPGAENYQDVPMLRGRITRLAGKDVSKIRVPPDLAWMLRGDRGITWTADPPAGADIVAGSWWSQNYNGPPLVSLDQEAADGFGLKIGDNVTVNVLGKEVTGTIANLRRVDWSTLGINFVMIFSPGILEKAPRTHIATINVPPATEPLLLDRMARQFPNILAIRVSDALASAMEILNKVAFALRSCALAVLIAGTLVLAGVVANLNRRRNYESVLIKMLGGRRREILGAYILEFALLSGTGALFALAAGSGVAWLFLTFVLKISPTFHLVAIAEIFALALAGAMAAGFATASRALSATPAAFLRNE